MTSRTGHWFLCTPLRRAAAPHPRAQVCRGPWAGPSACLRAGRRRARSAKSCSGMNAWQKVSVGRVEAPDIHIPTVRRRSAPCHINKLPAVREEIRVVMSGLVRAQFGCWHRPPPPDGTRSSGPPRPPSRISRSAPQATSPRPCPSQMTVDGPPSTLTFFSWPPAKNARDRLSGDLPGVSRFPFQAAVEAPPSRGVHPYLLAAALDRHES